MSPLSISELIGVATGIGPHASLKQIDEIAALLVDDLQAEKIREKLVKRLRKPRIYGLLCVYKTLYLISKLIPTSHGKFYEYWTQNCGLFDNAYLKDPSDQDEVQTCQDIKNLSKKIKAIIKQLDERSGMKDGSILPSAVVAVVACPEVPSKALLSCPEPNTPPVVSSTTTEKRSKDARNPNEEARKAIKSSHLNVPSRPASGLSPKLNERPLSKDSRLAVINNATPQNRGKSNTTHPSPGMVTRPLANNTSGAANANTTTSRSSPTSLLTKLSLKKFLSPVSPLASLPQTVPPHDDTPFHSDPPPVAQTHVDTPRSGQWACTDETLVSLTPYLRTPTSNPHRPLPLDKGTYTPKKSVHIRDTPDIIEILDLPSTTETDSSETDKGKQDTENKKGGDAPELQRLTAPSVVLTDNKDDLPKTPLFQEPVWDITECIQRTDSDPFERGGYADVWKGDYTWLDQGKPKQEIVAIKKSRKGTHITGEITVKLYQEVHTWQKLAHKNIVPFYGIYMFPDGLYGMVSPFFPNGHVIQYLKGTKEDPIKLLYDVAKGIEYLHLKTVIHGDIKGTNILVHDDGHACLMDFGLAQIQDEQMMALGQINSNTGTSLRWSAPELLKPASVKTLKTEKSDVYSFACTAVEMMILKVPYSHISDPAALIRKICSGEHPTRPRSPSWEPSDGLWILLRSCWNGRAEERPTIREVTNELKLYVPQTKLGERDISSL